MTDPTPPADPTRSLPPEPDRTADHRPDPARTLTQPTAGQADPPPPLLAGRYRLELPPLGEGGMGVVYAAEQVAPIRRRVAVKLIRPGRDSAGVLARFEAERQALARMDHPNVARVFDAGTDTGRPFVVMELVAGAPLAEHCDAHRLPLADRLRLFQTLCEAVHHAHQKGVIHRDLKPSNVLVTADGQVKVIDFGLAKAVGDGAGGPHLTAAGAVLGTPLYMAPEQAGGDPADVDTRTDVYALGAVLYELLTGTTPLDRDRMHKAAFAEMLRLVREEEPPPPSRRLARPADATLSLAAEARGTDPRRLAAQVRGDLDWVVMRALDKDRRRRYESAAALGADVGRFLAVQPVAAGPPSAAYRLRKFARRNRAAVAVGGAVTAAVLAGVVGLAAGLVRARAAERAAVAAADREAAQRRQAQEALGLLLLAVGEADPKRSGVADDRVDPATARAASLRAGVDAVARSLTAGTVTDPEVADQLRMAVGRTYVGLNAGPQAAEQFRLLAADRTTRLGPDHRDTLDARYWLALGLHASGDHADALTATRAVSADAARLLGPDDRLSLIVHHELADLLRLTGKAADALPVAEDCEKLTAAVFGADHASSLEARNLLGNCLLAAGRTDRAVVVLREVLDRRRARFGADDFRAVNSLNDLAVALRQANRFAEAVTLLEEARERMRPRLAPHPDVLTVLGNLGATYRRAGRPADGVRVLTELAELQRPAGGPTRLSTLNNLGLAALSAGRPGLAVAALEECVAGRRAGGLPFALSAVGLAQAYRQAGRPDDAIRLTAELTAGPDTPDTVALLTELGATLSAVGRPAEAAAVFERRLAIVRRAAAADAGPAVTCTLELFEALLDAGRPADARRVIEPARTAWEGPLGKTWVPAYTRARLGEAFLMEGRTATGESHLSAGLAVLLADLASLPPAARPRAIRALDRAIRLLRAAGLPADVWVECRAALPAEQAPLPRVE